MQLKKPNKNQTLIFTLVIAILLLNIFQGSKISFDSSACYPTNLEEGLIILGVLAIVILFPLRKTEIIKKIILPILLASILIYVIEPFIYDYQLNRTNRNLKTTCDAIEQYKSDHGRLPNTLEEIGNLKNFNSGFKLFNNKFSYSKDDDESFKIQYEVKYGYICEVWNGSTQFSNLFYTCIECGNVHNEKLNNKRKNELQ